MSKFTVANLKLRDVPFKIRLRPKTNLFIGALFLLATSCIVALCLILILYSILKVAPCAFLLFIVLTISAATKGWRKAQRYLLNPQSTLLKDARMPILFLRAFDSDYKEISKVQNKKTPEEVLAHVLNWVGPVIAVGKHDDSGPPLLGATRIYFEGMNWQRHVESLIEISRLVVFHPGHSAGILWELEAARRLLTPNRLLISFLHWQVLEDPESYGKFSGSFFEIFGHQLPTGPWPVSFICFAPDWTPLPISVVPRQPLVNTFLQVRFKRYNPWWPVNPYSPYFPVSLIADALLPVLRERRLIHW